MEASVTHIGGGGGGAGAARPGHGGRGGTSVLIVNGETGEESYPQSEGSVSGSYWVNIHRDGGCPTVKPWNYGPIDTEADARLVLNMAKEIYYMTHVVVDSAAFSILKHIETTETTVIE